MRVNHRTLVRLILLLALACAVATPGVAEEGLPTHNRIAEPVVGATRIDWLPAGDSERLVLTVAGPAGLWVRKEFAAGQPVSLSLSDPEWERLPDGTYTWELRVISPPGKLPQRPLVESGHFFVKDGSFVPARKKAPVAPPRPPRLITAESHINDDLSVTGNVCIGISCSSTDPDPNLPSLILKAQQPHIRFDDQFVEGGSTPHDWAVFINPVSAAEFSIADVENGRIPFTIAGGAPNSSVYVASSGNVGLGTATPSALLHLQNRSGNTNTNVAVVTSTDSQTLFRVFETTSTGGVVSVFDSGGNEDIRLSATGASWLASDSHVGIGTVTPTKRLTIKSAGGNDDVVQVVKSSGSTPLFRIFETTSGDGLFSVFDNTGAEAARFSSVSGGRVSIGCNAPEHDLDLGNAPGVACSSVSARSHIDAGESIFTTSSSRTLKENLAPVQVASILDKVSGVKVYTYDFIQGPKGKIGLMAEDFHAIFGRGSDKEINGQEVQMALWLAVQELSKQVAELKALLAIERAKP